MNTAKPLYSTNDDTRREDAPLLGETEETVDLLRCQLDVLEADLHRLQRMATQALLDAQQEKQRQISEMNRTYAEKIYDRDQMIRWAMGGYSVEMELTD